MNGFTQWWRTVGVLTGLELRQRTRATRWRVLLGVFFLVVSAVVFGSLWFALAMSPERKDWAYDGWSENLYFIVLGFVGFLGLVISPTMTATSINGDRKDATLAVVQATPASGSQIAAGKLLGAWIASCALLLVSMPYIIWATVEAPYPVWASVLGVVVVTLLFLSYCGIGLGFSALLSRPIGSAAVTQLAMLFLLIGLPLITVMLVPTTVSQQSAMQTRFEYNDSDNSGKCTEVREQVEVTHTERIWWILAPNPAVVFADAASQSEPGRRSDDFPRRYADYTGDEPDETALGALADIVSDTRTGPNPDQDRTCSEQYANRYPSSRYDDWDTTQNVGRTWYWGLLANLALGGIGLAFAARRLRVPAAKLPRGVRIA
ncbi:ABC transporter permease [Tsukamurella ocularis]|uniref:ABC transporter permease n=1 Tax=Tsukamurella ocularis TaxID=1970234 RepID=UPI0021670B97|nr:ABC transporter permease [Tsukamurella ocularis]MCS3778793.1 ABC-type transport system involved in multi-copper enzyme maturation permease subunit [Tsukamurella ocularis]MCS3787587.1 ABC-type transport system involved in multi-copper enzyme maturation permease subunit [Tsukamurella ocularis]MCS3851476.1 ABC-type transport system involved in multi-copper enzyme maturation permease subunit [Tsukamurella ocularis]